MPLPQPLGRFYVTNVDANILPNPDAGMRLEGVLAPNDALRHAHKLEGVASSGGWLTPTLGYFSPAQDHTGRFERKCTVKNYKHGLFILYHPTSTARAL